MVTRRGGRGYRRSENVMERGWSARQQAEISEENATTADSVARTER